MAGRWDIPSVPGYFHCLPCDPDNFIPIFCICALISDAPSETGSSSLSCCGWAREIGWVDSCCTSSLPAWPLPLSSGFCPGFFCCRTWSGEPIGARVLTTAAVAGGQFEYNVPLALSYGCMVSATPLEATLWVAGTMIVVCFLLGR